MADAKRTPQFGPVYDSTGRLMASVARLDVPPIQHFTPGEAVEVLRGDPRCEPRWVTGIVMRDAPYPKGETGGAYVRAAGVEGWASQRTIRRVAIAKATGSVA